MSGSKVVEAVPIECPVCGTTGSSGATCPGCGNGIPFTLILLIAKAGKGGLAVLHDDPKIYMDMNYYNSM